MGATAQRNSQKRQSDVQASQHRIQLLKDGYEIFKLYWLNTLLC